MMKSNLLIIFFLCAASVYPATSISRWFSASYHDLRVTLRRYGHCVGELPPLKDSNMNETEFLVQQMRLFLDQANYDNEQLANITMLMDGICHSSNGDPSEYSYPISVSIDVNEYNHTVTGKMNRCRAIDESMDAMYNVFKRAAVNKSEPLDFSAILFYPNQTNKAAFYNLTDLINTSWIKSDTVLEHVCKITDSVKDYVQARMSNSTAQDRWQQANTGYFGSFMAFVDRLMDSILGNTKRLYWEGNNRFEMVNSRLSNQLSNLRNGIGTRYKSTRDVIVGLFASGPSNSTTLLATPINATNASGAVVVTTLIGQQPQQPVATVALNKTLARR